MPVRTYPVTQRVERHEVEIVIDTLQNDDVRRCVCNDRGNRLDLRIAAQDIAQQEPRPLAGQLGMISGDADLILCFGGQADQTNRQQQRGNQAFCMPSASALA